ncbi:MAG: hypothetical protein CMJ77_17585 [Planctomycetaceae bacterium]|nr:hypothetical protein [Planctomycetaceae bacterium]
MSFRGDDTPQRPRDRASKNPFVFGARKRPFGGIFEDQFERPKKQTPKMHTLAMIANPIGFLSP